MSPTERLLRSYLAAGDAFDRLALHRVLDPNVVTHSPGGEVVRGRDGLIAAWTAAHAGLAGLRHDVVDVVADDHRAVARVRVSGTHTGPFLGVPPTARRVEVDQTVWACVAPEADGSGDGRIVELWEVVDTGAGLRQLGVLDHPLAPGSGA